jgi:hypothetical protein
MPGMNYGSETPGPATSSFLQQPNSVAVDAAGNVFIADARNHVVSKVDTAGNLSIVAGTGNGGSPSDSNGDPLATNLEQPNGAVLDALGNLFIVDAANQIVVKVTEIGSLAPALLSSSVSISNLPSSGAYGGSFTPTISTTGDGATSVTSSTTDVCTVNSSTVNFVGVGTCTLVAHVAKGSSYASADGADQSFVVAATKPSAPSAPVLADNHGTIGLTWTPPTNTGGAPVTYTVQERTSSGSWSELATGLTQTSYTFTTPAAKITYVFAIVAVNSAGRSPWSASSWIWATVVAPSVPGAPALTDNHGSIGLTWTPSSKSGGAPVTYGVAVQVNQASWLPVVSGLTSPSYTFVGSRAGNTYTFVIVAANSAGSSGWSPTTSVTATAVKPSAPPKPVLTARHGLIEVAWSAPANFGGDAVTYTVRVKTNSGGWRQVATGLKGRSLTYFNTQAINTYTFSVSAVNRAGASPWSLAAAKKAV